MPQQTQGIHERHFWDRSLLPSMQGSEMTRTKTKRLFVALMADERLQQAVTTYRDDWVWPNGATLVMAANLHVTLRFIGEVDHARLQRLKEWLAHVPPPDFRIELRSPACSADGAACVDLPLSDGLVALHERVSAASTWAGFGLQDPVWRPHMTLARNAKGASPPQLRPGIPWHVSSFELLQSADGVYTRVATWPRPKSSRANPPDTPAQ